MAAVQRLRPAEQVLRDATEVFKALASSVRLSIVHALAHDELSVGDLARVLDLSLSVASQQLSVLRRLKLVAGRDDGRLTFYRVIDDLVGHLVHDCLAHAEAKLDTPARDLDPPHPDDAPARARGRAKSAARVKR